MPVALKSGRGPVYGRGGGKEMVVMVRGPVYAGGGWGVRQTVVV